MASNIPEPPPGEVPEGKFICGSCGDVRNQLKHCPRCKQGVCAYCYEDGHTYMGEDCEGTLGEDDL